MRDTDGLELRDILNVVRARKWVIIQAVTVVVIAALVVSFLQPKTYEGTALVLISEKGSSASVFGDLLPQLSAQPERAMQTQVQLMQIRPIAEAAIKKLNLQVAPDALLKTVTVAAMGQTNLVKITVTGTDPKQTALIANTVADEYVVSARDAQRASLADAADEVQKRLDQAESQILDLGKRVSASGKTDQLAAELQIATGTYTTLAEKLEQLRINERLESGPGRVVSPAVVDDNAVSPRPLRNGTLGLAVGLVLGLGLALLFEYLDDTIKSTEEAETLYGAPVLGLIPADKYEKDEKRRLTLVTHPGTSTAEAYRVLRNSLDFINFEHNIKTLLVTSAAPAEGKSTVAANLAAGLAQSGNKVVLISCDFRRPTTQQFFDVSTMIGLSDVLTGANTMKSALQRSSELSNLLILTSGKLPPNPSELLSSHSMQALIKELENWADWVIIDSPPLLAVADAAAVARWVDGVLMVTRGGASSRDAAKKAAEMLGQVGARIIGSVVWGLEESSGGRGNGYYYGSGYKGYYYYADYYNQYQVETPASGRSKKTKKNVTSAVPSSQTQQQVCIPPTSLGRKLAETVVRVLAGVLAALAVIVIIVMVVYFLGQALGWDLSKGLFEMWYRIVGVR